MALYNGGFCIRTNPDRGPGEVFLGAKGAQNKELQGFEFSWPVARMQISA